MSKKRVSMIICLVTVLSLGNVLTQAATPPSETDDSGVESEEYFFDITSLGGVVQEEKNEIVVISSTGKTSEVNTSLAVEKADEFFSEDISAVATVKEQDEIALKKMIRDEKLEQAAWLLDYGIDTSTLSNERLDVLNEAKKWIGSWYVWGGTTPPQGSDWTYGNGGGGFDCSGYTRYVLNTSLGIKIPRTTYSQIGYSGFERIPISEAQPGDIIFNGSISHTGFFLKDNGGDITILHSPNTGDKVKVSRYSRPTYAYRYVE